jgi:hypothetical protein
VGPKAVPRVVVKDTHSQHTYRKLNSGIPAASLKLGGAMVQAVHRRHLNAKDLVQTHGNSYGICGGQSGTGVYFSQSTSVFPSVIIPSMLRTDLKLYDTRIDPSETALPRK